MIKQNSELMNSRYFARLSLLYKRCHRLTTFNFFRSVPWDEAIDLINVAFEQRARSSNAQTKSGKKRKDKQSANAGAIIETTNFSVPDRLTGIAGLEELQRINPARQWNLIEVSLRNDAVNALSTGTYMWGRHNARVTQATLTMLSRFFGDDFCTGSDKFF